MIVIKSPAEIEIMRGPNRIVGELLVYLKSLVKPGITTGELDKKAEVFIRKQGGIPAFKGYNGFPATICASINEEVVHGIPGKRELKEGDIIGIDLGAIKDGFYGDAARTFSVGKVDEASKRLMDVTETSLHKGIAQAVAGNRLYDISHAVQEHVEAAGFSVVRDFVGHGIGRQLHEDPQIPNYGSPHQGPLLEEGMVLAIEPMVNQGTWQVQVQGDGWTVVTADGKRSAHFENTIVITKNGPEILTGP
jgi:methionyl aminopeptidase